MMWRVVVNPPLSFSIEHSVTKQRFAPDQYGKVRSTSAPNLHVPGCVALAELKRITDIAVSERKAFRFGSRYSIERKRLYDLVAARLNASAEVETEITGQRWADG